MASSDYRENDIEQLLVYFTFRYIMNAIYEDVYKRQAAFSVFCLVEELRATDVNLNLSGREVTLEVGHVIHGIPQTELYI